MIAVQNDHDEILRQRFISLTEEDIDYWSFKGNSRREYGHGMFQYPAMMVPQVVDSILKVTCTVHPDIDHVGDPFSGSGTSMTETMMRGLSFSGTDINPLAILLCKVKSGPFYIDALKDKSEEVLLRIKHDRRWAIEVNFQNRDKWFNRDVQISLSKIRRSIACEKSLWARRFFWVSLAETVRLTSNSRTSTYKLHIRSQDEITSRTYDTIGIFKRILVRNIRHYEEQAKRLSEVGQISNGHYQRQISLKLADIRTTRSREDLDLIITSPPYGDNSTTVPYGQYSYLPLQWINLRDIDENIDFDCLSSTQEIDTRSLGGSKRLETKNTNHIVERSPTFRNFIKSLENQPRDRALRVTAFFRDLDSCLVPILKGLRPGGLMVWTLGNRKVGGNRVPLDNILADLLSTYNTKALCKLTRRITSKRMAPKNSIADTMTNETILIMRKGK